MPGTDRDGGAKPLEAKELTSSTEIISETRHADAEANSCRKACCLIVHMQLSCLKSHPVGQPVRGNAVHGTVRPVEESARVKRERSSSVALEGAVSISASLFGNQPRHSEVRAARSNG